MFSVRDENDPLKIRVHMHIEHEGSLMYYHFEYPTGGIPDRRWSAFAIASRVGSSRTNSSRSTRTAANSRATCSAVKPPSSRC